MQPSNEKRTLNFMRKILTTLPMKKIYFIFCFICFSNIIQAQSTFVDYSFLAVPPSVIVYKVVEQPDGKILVGGAFTNYAGSGKKNLVRLNHDGTLDATFNIAGAGPDNMVRDLVLMSDGRIIVCGNFVSYNSTGCSFVIRLHSDGSVDNTFNVPPNAINGAILAVELHTDDKVLAAGEFFTCNGHSQPHITRFNYNGTTDTTFNIGTGFNTNVYDLLVLPDTRILASGRFNSFNGNICGNIALLSPGGPYDATMNNSPGFSGMSISTAYDLERQSDGKILVAGDFSYHNGQLITGIARLDINGSRDLSFTPPFYPFAIIKAIAVQADNKIIAGGEFTDAMYNVGITGPNRIARMNINGIIDNSFAGGIGFNSPNAFINDITIESDNKILVGGLFGSFDTETIYKQIIRLNSDPSGVSELTAVSQFQFYPNPSSGSVFIENPFTSTNEARLIIYASNGKKVIEKNITFGVDSLFYFESNLNSGIYLFSLQTNESIVSRKVIVR